MNSHNPVIDLAEVASEVVRVAYMDGLTIAAATNSVMTQRGMEYGEALSIMRMAQEIVDKNPRIKEAVTSRTQRHYMSPGLQSLVARSAEAQARIEDNAPVIEEPRPQAQMLPNGQYEFGNLFTTPLQRAV